MSVFHTEKLSKVLILALFVSVGCESGGTTKYSGSGGDYVYSKDCSEMVYFKSSDAGLDRFINDFNRRHLRYDEEAIGREPLGVHPTFGKEWDALSLMYFDATKTNIPNDRHAMMREWLDKVNVDRFGYVWSKLDEPRAGNRGGATPAASQAYFGQGWPLPSYHPTRYSKGRSAGWEFNVNAEGWTAASRTAGGTNTPVQPVISSDFTDGYLSVRSGQGDRVILESPVFSVDPFVAPFIEYDMKLTDLNGNGNESNIADVQIWFQTNQEATWTTDKMVSITDFATIPTPEIRAYSGDRVYFPMYLLPKYDEIDGGTRKITKLRLVIQGKTGVENLNIKADVNNIRFAFDTRHSDNIGLFLSTAKTYFEFTNDTAFLQKNMDRIRRATQAYLNMARAEDGLHTLTSYRNRELNPVDPKNKIGYNIVNGYYDNWAVPFVNMDANVYYYKGLTSAIYLEKMAGTLGGITTNTKASLAEIDGDRKMKDVAYAQDAGSLETIRAALGEAIRNYFWCEEKGRFFHGYDETVSPKIKIDFGVSIYNMMAIAEGIASREQAESIYAWLNGDRIVASDIVHYFASDDIRPPSGSNNVLTGSTGKDIYYFGVAPRISTVHNTKYVTWFALEGMGDNKVLNWHKMLQNGGVVVYSAYYDLMSRIRVLGANDGFDRLKGVQAWYDPILDYALENGFHGMDFYRAFYNQDKYASTYGDPSGNGTYTGPNAIRPVGGGQGWGNLGADYEFHEAAVLIASIPYGFFGVGNTHYNVLDITPNFPNTEGFDFWKIENLMFNGIKYDLSIGKGWAQLNSVRGNIAGKQVRIALPVTAAASTVKINGVATTDFVTVGDRVIVTTNFPAEGEELNVLIE